MAENAKYVTLDDSNFEEEVLNSDVPVLVDFWAAWCAPCRLVAPTIEELAADHAGSVKVGKLNVDDNPKTAALFAIHSLPSVLLFRNGEVVETFVGVQPKQRYEEALAPYIASL